MMSGLPLLFKAQRTKSRNKQRQDAVESEKTVKFPSICSNVRIAVPNDQFGFNKIDRIINNNFGLP